MKGIEKSLTRKLNLGVNSINEEALFIKTKRLTLLLSLASSLRTHYVVCVFVQFFFCAVDIVKPQNLYSCKLLKIPVDSGFHGAVTFTTLQCSYTIELCNLLAFRCILYNVF